MITERTLRIDSSDMLAPIVLEKARTNEPDLKMAVQTVKRSPGRSAKIRHCIDPSLAADLNEIGPYDTKLVCVCTVLDNTTSWASNCELYRESPYWTVTIFPRERITSHWPLITGKILCHARIGKICMKHCFRFMRESVNISGWIWIPYANATASRVNGIIPCGCRRARIKTGRPVSASRPTLRRN